MTPLKMIIVAVGVIGMIFLGFGATNIWENVPADQICIIQNVVDGKLNVYTEPGLKLQKFGAVTYYPKRFVLEFAATEHPNGNVTGTNKVRFNDGGEGYISGSINVDMPLDAPTLQQIHIKYGSYLALYNELVKPVFAKSVYMSGPLMSSKESYSERRNELIYYIEDQAINGVYKTKSQEVKGIDPMTGQPKTITEVHIVKGEDGTPLREDKSPLDLFGIKTYNMSIDKMPYTQIVQAQIASQQEAIMKVQTSIANAKEAEQRAITVAKNGEAEAAKSKWEQEVIKARAVVTAEQQKQVAELERDAAKFEKEKQILLGEGEAKRKQLVMSADGALKQKLATYESVMAKFAEEFGKQKWTPDISINSGGTNGNDVTGGRVNELMDLLTIKTADQLRLDMGMATNK